MNIYDVNDDVKTEKENYNTNDFLLLTDGKNSEGKKKQQNPPPNYQKNIGETLTRKTLLS